VVGYARGYQLDETMSQNKLKEKIASSDACRLRVRESGEKDISELLASFRAIKERVKDIEGVSALISEGRKR